MTARRGFPGRHPLLERVLLPAALVLLPLAPQAVCACASCGCSLSGDAAMGYSTQAGWRFSLEYDYIHQDQLRSGTRAVSGVPDGNELERETLNRYFTAGISYSPNSAWNVTLYAPYVARTHSTYGEVESGEPLPELSSSRSASLGDVRLLGSYQGFLATRNLGVTLGVKLPTGATDVRFFAGPLAGEPLDASLQPGTGSTDVIVGAYYYRAIAQDWDVFVNGLFQAAVHQRQDEPGNDFRPGNAVTLSAGVRYVASPRLLPQLQLNFVHKAPDTGALADVQNSAGSVVYLSPGLSVAITRRFGVFAFVQLPLYSNLYGYQLFPRWTASVGASYAL